MSTCIVCLSSGDEASLKSRYMLPCHCELCLCDECVQKIMVCPYHRRRSPPTDQDARETLLAVLNAIKRERTQLLATVEELAHENKFQKKCCVVLALASLFFVISKDVLTLFNSVRLSWAFSIIAVLWSSLAYLLFRPGTLAEMKQDVWKMCVVSMVACVFILK
jgi:hypothetical protein